MNGMPPWEKMNEAGVREECIAPWLRGLGYWEGGEGDIQREVVLKYAKGFIGHKNPKKDPPLPMGKADYVMTTKTASGELRWVLEAKPPNEPVDGNVLDQVYSYAKHPDIGAVLYAVCNGRELALYETSTAPHTTTPLYRESWPEWSASLGLRDHVALDSFRTRFERLLGLRGTPLGPGLSASMKVASGMINYTQVPEFIAHARDMLITIEDGRMDRDEQGRLRCEIIVRGNDRNTEEMLERNGLKDMILISTAERLCSQTPTVFLGGRRYPFSKGEKLTHQGTLVELHHDIEVLSAIKISGMLDGSTISGKVELGQIIVGFPDPLAYSLRGAFKVRLAF